LAKLRHINRSGAVFFETHCITVYGYSFRISGSQRFLLVSSGVINVGLLRLETPACYKYHDNSTISRTSRGLRHVGCKQVGADQMAGIRTYSPGHFSLSDNSPSIFTCIGHFPLPPPPSAILQYIAVYR